MPTRWRILKSVSVESFHRILTFKYSAKWHKGHEVFKCNVLHSENPKRMSHMSHEKLTKAKWTGQK